MDAFFYFRKDVLTIINNYLKLSVGRGTSKSLRVQEQLYSLQPGNTHRTLVCKCFCRHRIDGYIDKYVKRCKKCSFAGEIPIKFQSRPNKPCFETRFSTKTDEVLLSNDCFCIPEREMVIPLDFVSFLITLFKTIESVLLP